MKKYLIDTSKYLFAIETLYASKVTWHVCSNSTMGKIKSVVQALENNFNIGHISNLPNGCTALLELNLQCPVYHETRTLKQNRGEDKYESDLIQP